MSRYIAIVVLLFCSVNFALAQESAKPSLATQKMLSSENGRFVFGQISEYRRDQYVLDTKTGRLWQKVVAKVGKPGEETEVDVLQPIYYETKDGTWVTEPK